MHPDDEGLNELRLEICIEKHAAELVRVEEVTELVAILSDENVITALYHAKQKAADITDRVMLEKLYSLATQNRDAVMSYYNDRSDGEL